jgi:hypothetical protein
MVNQVKLRSYRTAPKYQYGFKVPKDYQHAVRLDEKAGNTKLQDSTKLEMAQLDNYDYNTFKDYGHLGKSPDGYKKVRVHLVFAVKHAGRHKSRLVANGHLTDVPIDRVYSGVVSLCGPRLLVFLAELNGLDTWATYIGNAYLEAETLESIFIVAGPIPWLSSRHCTASGLLVCAGTNASPIVYEIWVLNLPSPNQTSGCARTVISTTTSQSMWTTWR